jgi:hypothetical protein
MKKLFFFIVSVILCQPMMSSDIDKKEFAFFFKGFYSLVTECSIEAKSFIKFPFNLESFSPVDETSEKLVITKKKKLHVCDLIGGDGKAQQPIFTFSGNQVTVVLTYSNPEFRYEWYFEQINGKWFMIGARIWIT